ncbi:MAG: heparinase II/III family protein, partial [Methylobacteriaceae bacterium]|nr:heparinase II/III family protein [Methylobacteriaceae bacterium]
MSVARAPDRWRLYRLALREVAGSLPRSLRRIARLPRLRAPRPQRLLFAPQDLRTADPTVAQDLASGHVALAGAAAPTYGASPFAIEPPSEPWAEALWGFGWLRHFRTLRDPELRALARTLVVDAVRRHRGALGQGPARRTGVVARRLISFLCQSPIVLAGADHGDYQIFLRAIGGAVAALERDLAISEDAGDRLAAAIALAYAALCCSGLENRLGRATRVLSAELDRQILPDGGHASRHPGLLVEILLDLLPLRLLYMSRGVEPPEAMTRAIARMMPMLRHLRHAGGGEIGLFNGMGRTAIDHVATLLSYDLTQAPAPDGTGPSGYVRLQAVSTTVLADVGSAPPLALSGAAHAGALSFELSAGSDRIVVNRGAPRGRPELRDAARHTAAHSTLEYAGTSSATFLHEVEGPVARWLARRLGPAMLSAPRAEHQAAVEPDGSLSVTARHDGYLARFGIVHERRLRLDP